MFRALLWTLRQRRYAALAVAGLVLALICVGAGTFEMHRFQEKRHDNARLQGNAHAAPVPLSTRLVPLVGDGAAPSAFAIRYRTVTATGTYQPDAQTYVGNQTQGGRQGFYVLTPLRTSGGVLLVVRGFVPSTPSATRPADIAAPPSRRVRVSGWLDTAQTTSDRLGALGHGEITSINAKQQATRLGASTYDAYVTLTARQPGTSGLTVVPLPDLSNPTGGAVTWQLFSYIIQWYVFAALALMLPFVVSRSEVRDARRRFLGVEPGEVDAEPGAELVLRGPGGTLVPRGQPTRAQWARASRLADRYGRSLGIDAPPAVRASRPGGPPTERIGGVPDIPERPVVPSSAVVPHRSDDSFHGSYNDYLWQLALADGNVPSAPDDQDGDRPVP